MRAQALNDEDIFAHEDDEERGHSCDDSDESGEEGSGEENDEENDEERVEARDDDFDDIVDDLSDGEAEHDEEADRHRKLVAVKEDRAKLDEVSVARICVPLLSPCYFNAPRWACQRVSAQAPNEKWRPWPPRRRSVGCPRCLPR